MTELILHIGTHKTGTTAIQNYGYDQRDSLRAQGVLWAPGEVAVNSDLHGAVQHAPIRQHSSLAFALQTGEPQRLEAYVAHLASVTDGSTRAVIMSGEEFSLLGGAHVQQLKSAFAPFNVRIIVFLRNHYRRLMAGLIQRAKAGRMLPPKDMIFRRAATFLDYDALLHRWEAAFGANAVDVCHYETVAHNIVPHFFERCGITDLPPAVADRRDNASLTLSEAMMLDGLGALTRVEDYIALHAAMPEPLKPVAPNSKELSFADMIIATCHESYGLNAGAPRHPKLKGFASALITRPSSDDRDSATAIRRRRIDMILRALDHVKATQT